MLTKNLNNRIVFSVLLIAIGVIGRMLPHAWNMTPIVAIGLVAGVYLGARYAWAVPLLAMLISDFFIGFYFGAVMLFVYASFAGIGLIGLLIRSRNTILTRITASLTGSTLFFLVTNWAVWQFGTMYSKSYSGLVMSYSLGLPFFKNALYGDLVYTLGLFLAVESVLVVSTYIRRNKCKQLIGNTIFTQ